MRVLHLLKTSIGATWAFRQMEQLVRRGIDVHVALPAGGALVPRYCDAGITTHFYNLDFPLRDPRAISANMTSVRELHDRLRPDIVHSHFVGTTLTMRLGLGRPHPTARVFQVPGPLHLEHTFFRRAELATAGKNDHWIATCEWIKDRYQRSGVPSNRLHFTHYGWDIGAFTGHPKGKLRAELGIGTDTKLIGMVAYMYAPKRYLGQRRGLKGHEDLFDALALLPRDMNARCIIIGSAWGGATEYEARLRAYAEQRAPGRVTFLGLRHDVPELYPDFDVAVHPSHTENMGGATESLLSGVPTIATNVGGFPDVIKPGITGWLVPRSSPAHLAKAITQALEDPEYGRQLTLAGRELVTELFDLDRAARETVEIYERILQDH